MTDEELDEARAKAALERHPIGMKWDAMADDLRDILILAARYGREGTQPTDPDLVLAREVVAQEYRRREFSIAAKETMAGARDDEVAIQAALAAIRAVRAEKAP